MGQQIILPPAYQRPSGMLLLGADQLNILAGGVDVTIEIDTIPAAFTDGIENAGTYRITPGVAGFYCIVANIRFFNVINDKAYSANIFLDGARIATNLMHASDPAITSINSVCVLPCQYLSAINFLELVANCYAGANTVDILGDVASQSTFLAVQRVR